MYLKRLVLEDIRGFESLTLDFTAANHACRMRTLVLVAETERVRRRCFAQSASA
jgi:hypothetical protein